MRRSLLLLLSGLCTNVIASELTEDFCQKQVDSSVLADCMDARIHDPCDSATGSSSLALCKEVHEEVALRRLHRATHELANKTKQARVTIRPLVNERGEVHRVDDPVVEGNRAWFEYSKVHCSFLNELDQANIKAGMSIKDCEILLIHQRADMLETILANLKIQ